MSDERENDVEMEETQEAEIEPKAEFSSNQIRKAYRDIREDMIENRLEYVNPNSNYIEKTLEKVDYTFKSVKKPREAVSDSTVMLELTILAKERIKNVHCAFRSFNNMEFMDKLKVYMASMVNNGETSRAAAFMDTIVEDENESDEEMPRTSKRADKNKKAQNSYVLTKPILTKFGSKVMSYFRILPKPKFLLGALEKELTLTKAKVVRQKRAPQRDVEAVKTKIVELAADSKEETNNTVGETERIYKMLTKYHKKLKGEPICLYEFMINPHSFSRTIENIFYISFLVKDGFVKVYLDSHNLPVIEPVPKEQQQNRPQDNKKSAVNIQSMISLNKLEWKELIEVFGIQTALIKDPAPENQ